MAVVVSILLMIAAFTRAPWPGSPREALHIAVAGLLVHATYLSGVLYAIVYALPLGFVAMIAGLQPVVTAVFAHLLLGERLNARQWFGMLLGLVGVGLVIASKFNLGNVNVAGLLMAGIALVGITAGTLYQKRFCQHMDLRTGGVIQYSATAIVLGMLALAFESRQVAWTAQFIGALFWLAIVLSIGAIGLLYLMIRLGAASKVASLFFLTPSVTAVLAWILFGETMSILAIGGLAVTAMGVALVMRK